MAIYHMSIKIISRGKGKSSVAAAAYRTADKIKNEYDGMTHDYTHKGGVIHTEILLPAYAPPEYQDRAVLWNAVEKIEKAKNAQLARELEIALPVELSKVESVSLVHEYVNRHFVSAGMCADIAIHDTGGGNPHAHILLTMRPFNEDRTWGDKQKKVYLFDKDGNKIYDPKKRQYQCNKAQTTDWNEQTKAEEWRGAWSECCNAYLERGGHAERIDHRSYARQGIDQIPTIHLGVAASQMEKKGIRTERGDINREIEVTNQQLRQLKARIVKLQSWVKAETENTEPPSLADVLQAIFRRKAQPGKSSTSQSIYNIKDGANMLNFLRSHEIMDMAGLDECFANMIDRQQDIREKLKPIDRRLKTLDEHIRHSGNFKGHRGKKAQYEKLYAQYETLNKATGFGAGRKAHKALAAANEYHEKYRLEITSYEEAELYLKDVLHAHFDPKKTPPITKWKSEISKLTAERKRIEADYYKLKNEVVEAEQIRRSVYSIMRQERQERQPQRSHDMGL